MSRNSLARIIPRAWRSWTRAESHVRPIQRAGVLMDGCSVVSSQDWSTRGLPYSDRKRDTIEACLVFNSDTTCWTNSEHMHSRLILAVGRNWIYGRLDILGSDNNFLLLSSCAWSFLTAQRLCLTFCRSARQMAGIVLAKHNEKFGFAWQLSPSTARIPSSCLEECTTRCHIRQKSPGR